MTKKATKKTKKVAPEAMTAAEELAAPVEELTPSEDKQEDQGQEDGDEQESEEPEAEEVPEEVQSAKPAKKKKPSRTALLAEALLEAAHYGVDISLAKSSDPQGEAFTMTALVKVCSGLRVAGLVVRSTKLPDESPVEFLTRTLEEANLRATKRTNQGVYKKGWCQ